MSHKLENKSDSPKIHTRTHMHSGIFEVRAQLTVDKDRNLIGRIFVSFVRE